MGRVGNPSTPAPAAVTHKDRPKLPLFVLAVGAILLGADALQSLLIVGPGPQSSGRHPISADTRRLAATPSPWNPPSPAVKVPPAEPDDQFLVGTVPDAPQSADHPVDLSHPASPPEPKSTSPEPPADAAAKPETAPSAAAPSPEKAAEPKAETLPEVKPAPEPEPAELPKSESVEVKAEPVPAVAPKAKIKGAVAESKSLKPKPVPATKIVAREAKPKPAEPKAAPVEKPKETVAAAVQRKITAKPMSLGFGRVTKPTAPAGKASSGYYAASVRAAIGRHRPAPRGSGSAVVAFAIGPAGGITGLRIARSSGKTQLDQAAIATVRSAAPFPPPPAGVNPAFSIQIFFH
jgi:periplasmic protein TonB